MLLKPKTIHFYMRLSFLLLLTGCQYLPSLGLGSDTSEVIASQKWIEGHEFTLDREQNLLGRLAVIETQKDDTLPDLARHFGLGHNAIVAANPQIDLWLPEPQTRVLLPLWFTLPDVARKGIVLNLANMRLFYFPPKQPHKVLTYPAGIGREGWNTPMGLTQVISKTKNPVWSVPPSIQREHALKGDPLPKTVPAGADNPLGEYAMKLAKAGYLIHGTNKPYGVGLQVSHGCLNLYPEDISELFKVTTVGTPVMIIDQPYLVAWQQGMLFLEAHAPLDASKEFKQPLLTKIKQLAKKYKVTVDWTKVDQIIDRASGIPTPILSQSASFASLAENALLLPHPEKLYGQPSPQVITSRDWSITVAVFADERAAQKLAAVLNHQGPSIPTRVEQQGERYQIIAGPFSSKKQVQAILKRLEIELELKGTINPPRVYISAVEPFLTSR